MPKRNHRRSWFKVGGLLVAILFFMVFYLVTINSTSTKGYFLRQSMKELEDVEFYHNVAKFQLAVAQKRLWDTIDVDFVGERNSRVSKQDTDIVRLTIDRQ